MNIGILGSGDVGRALGTGFAAHGHAVMIGSRDARNEKVETWAQSAGAGARGGTFADAARFGEVIVIATLWGGTENAIRLAGTEAFAGKVVIDATNPLDFGQGMAPRLAVGHTDSAGEQIQRWLPAARVVKCFNTIGNAHMVNPQFAGGRPDAFLCGDDDDAKRVVSGLCEAFGLAPRDIGGIEGARYLEPMAMVWITHAIRTGAWSTAFKLLER